MRYDGLFLLIKRVLRIFSTLLSIFTYLHLYLASQ